MLLMAALLHYLPGGCTGQKTALLGDRAVRLSLSAGASDALWDPVDRNQRHARDKNR